MPDPAAPFVSVCICTHDRPRYVRACLEALGRQTAPPGTFEILVIDSCSSPAAAAELASLVSGTRQVRLLRADRPGLSVARNLGAEAAGGHYVAYIDDDAISAPDWIAIILSIVAELPVRPALLGGRLLPLWEKPLPGWWPTSLRGVLSIIEDHGAGEYRTDAVPSRLEPYGANMIVLKEALIAVGGFSEATGRHGTLLLSDEDVQLAWRLQDAGYSVRFDSRLLVWHRIQANRLTPQWLLTRLYWQGFSTVLTDRSTGRRRAAGSGLARRLLVRTVLAPFKLVPTQSTRLFAWRWRLAYSSGFVRAALRPGLSGRAMCH